MQSRVRQHVHNAYRHLRMRKGGELDEMAGTTLVGYARGPNQYQSHPDLAPLCVKG